MKDNVKIGRIILTLFIVISIGLLFLFIAQEINANKVAAIWANAGFPDLREPHHNYFWSKIYACLGVACLSFGALLGLFSDRD